MVLDELKCHVLNCGSIMRFFQRSLAVAFGVDRKACLLIIAVMNNWFEKEVMRHYHKLVQLEERERLW